MDMELFDDENVINGIVMRNEVINNVVNHLVELEEQEEGDMQVVTRNENYFEITCQNYNISEFREHFRMSRIAMEALFVEIGNRSREMRNPMVELEKKILMTIWILAKPESFLACSDRFGVAKSTAHYVFKEIVGILKDMMDSSIQWPTRQQCVRYATIFEERSRGIPNVIGAIDGTHIFIKQPQGNAVDYYNRYQSHSVILQAVCDPFKKFIDISVGHPGRQHDARVFRRSTLYRSIMNADDPLILPPMHIIGDAAYPLLTELMTPYRDTGHLTASQVLYNTRFSSIRSIIERAFGLLKGKWRRLKYIDISDLQLLNDVVVSCCVLHNFVLNFTDVDDAVDDEGNEDVEGPYVIPNIVERRGRMVGELKRAEIANTLMN